MLLLLPLYQGNVEGREIIKYEIRNFPQYGAYNQLLCELQLSDNSSYKQFLKMDHESFQILLSKVSPVIAREASLQSNASR